MITEKINYAGWPNCIRLCNNKIELVASTDIGPRILHLGFPGSQNLFHLREEEKGNMGGENWRIYGGHRLWLAPEQIPQTYYPDNKSINSTILQDSIRLTQEKETTTGLVKEMEIRMSENDPEISIIHRIVHEGIQPVTISIWALSVLAAGGLAIIPQEPFGEGDAFLLPARSMALWQYTRMGDPRWHWGDRYILAKQMDEHLSEQKIGLLNKQRWVAYYRNKQVLIKEIEFPTGNSYPDFESNLEIYMNGSFLEIETLGPLTTVSPGQVIEHRERWILTDCHPIKTEADVDQYLMPIVRKKIL